CDTNSSLILLLENYIWRLLVDSNTKTFKFVFNNSRVSEGFVDIQDDENQMAGFCHGNNLSTSSLSVLGTLDNTWQIQHLYLGSIILYLARYRRKCCEFVCGGFGVLPGEFAH